MNPLEPTDAHWLPYVADAKEWAHISLGVFNAHDHRVYVNGCFRCDLSRGEQ